MGQRMSRKDSKSIFANLVNPQEQTGEVAPAASPSPHLRKVAAGLRQLHEREETFAKILKEGDRIIDIDVNDIAPSPIQDRFDGSYEESAIAEIVDSMRERGQIVPGLVRPLDNGMHHYQIVFGRRRWNAAKQLGLPFRAVVKELTDEQAIVYQGEENTNREDLTFLEKCLLRMNRKQQAFAVMSFAPRCQRQSLICLRCYASRLPFQNLHCFSSEGPQIPDADVG